MSIFEILPSLWHLWIAVQMLGLTAVLLRRIRRAPSRTGSVLLALTVVTASVVAYLPFDVFTTLEAILWQTAAFGFIGVVSGIVCLRPRYVVSVETTYRAYISSTVAICCQFLIAGLLAGGLGYLLLVILEPQPNIQANQPTEFHISAARPLASLGAGLFVGMLACILVGFTSLCICVGEAIRVVIGKRRSY